MSARCGIASVSPSCARGVRRAQGTPRCCAPPLRATAPASGDMLEVMNSLYEHAYEGLDRDVGLEIAEESHKKQARTPGIGYFYGELSWLGAWNLVGLAKPKVGDVFLDMGSGLGKMVLSTAMTRRFKQCVGVEILPELHQKACDAVTKLRESVGEDAFGMLPPIKLECGDMLAVDVGDADVVYCFATCFSPEIMGALESKLSAEMKPGARLVLVSKQMESNAFEPWGPNDGYVSVEQAHSKWNLDCYLYRKREESFDVSSSSATHRVAW